MFPDPIKKLPQADIQLPGLTAYIAQGKNHQVIFISFENDVEIPKHSHDDQWEIVLEGCVDLHLNGTTTRYSKGDRFFIPKGIFHAATVHSGYAAVVFFNETHRYREKKMR